MKHLDISISAGEGAFENGAPAIVLKIQVPIAELNIWISDKEVPLLGQVGDATWDARGSLRIGRSAKSSVFWSSSESELSILVGHDDETWDFALTLPRSALQRILTEVQTEQTAARDRAKSAAREQ